MTSILEKLVGVIAPHYCLSCGKENNILCLDCSQQYRATTPSQCFLCQKPTVDFAVCRSCGSTTRMERMWSAAPYEGVVAQVIKQFKFGRAQAASQSLALLLQQTLPMLPRETIIVPVPTAPARARQRGYDHTWLLAKALSRTTGLPCRVMLRRITNSRQLGANRHERLKQLRGAFEVTSPELCRDAVVLLVDDVVTTGATLLAAADALDKGGASAIYGATVAQHAASR